MSVWWTRGHRIRTPPPPSGPGRSIWRSRGAAWASVEIGIDSARPHLDSIHRDATRTGRRNLSSSARERRSRPSRSHAAPHTVPPPSQSAASTECPASARVEVARSTAGPGRYGRGEYAIAAVATSIGLLDVAARHASRYVELIAEHPAAFTDWDRAFAAEGLARVASRSGTADASEWGLRRIGTKLNAKAEPA
jgi:hypothetical protein